MNWTTLIPLKPDGDRKSRLAGALERDDRRRLSQFLLDHLVRQLRAAPEIGEIILLSDAPPPGWPDGWIEDRGRGLNGEVAAARTGLGVVPLLVIHADLPLVTVADIAALLAVAEAAGCAIAPDRHAGGTNALALADGRDFRFHFGHSSLALHVEEAGVAHSLVELPGLALDCDTPDDLDLAIAGGFVFPQ